MDTNISGECVKCCTFQMVSYNNGCTLCVLAVLLTINFNFFTNVYLFNRKLIEGAKSLKM